MYRDSVYDLLRMISSLKECLQDANISIERMLEIIESDHFKTEVYGSSTLVNPKGRVEFRNVRFGYKKKLVLSDLNFVVEANDTVAIVGKSGVGKSTVFNLLTKSYSPDDGMIFIDGIPICDLDEKSIKENISMICQNPYLFNMTILENLKLVKPEETKEEIINVCKLSQIHDYIFP